MVKVVLKGITLSCCSVKCKGKRVCSVQTRAGCWGRWSLLLGYLGSWVSVVSVPPCWMRLRRDHCWGDGVLGAAFSAAAFAAIDGLSY